MIKITLLVTDPYLIELGVSTFNEHCQYERQYVSSYIENEFIFEGKLFSDLDVDNINLDSDVVICRGISANLLRGRYNHLPVVEVASAGIDLIRCLDECKRRYGCKRVAAIGPMNMLYGAENISAIAGLEIKTYDMESLSNASKFVNLAASEGFKAVIGGHKVCRHAEELGLGAVFLSMGKESLWQAIVEAKRVARANMKVQEQAQLFKTILDYTYEGIIAVNDAGVVSVCNASAKKMLQLKTKDVAGLKVNDIVTKSKLSDLLTDEKEYLNEIIKQNEMQLTVNKVPIVYREGNVGNVVTFQNITKIQEMEGKIREKIYTRGHLAKHTFEDIIGESVEIKETIKSARRFSVVESNILIAGETGTGKELFAQSIHNNSPRRKGPFVAVNCAALPESLLESELFGYVDGAFTGAAKGGKAGLFELAHQGTIFLDEITELPLKLQGRLLRVIQEKEIMRLGHDRIIPIDVRVISAANRDLRGMVSKGDFRQDLYYRLDVLKLKLPPLRERQEDIPLLVQYFIELYGRDLRKRNMQITDKGLKMLKSYGWPGNIRELRNFCESLIVLSQSDVIDEKDIKAVFIDKCDGENAFVDEACVSIESMKGTDRRNINGLIKRADTDLIGELYAMEREKLLKVLSEVGNNKAKAAEKLGISTTTLWRRMKQLGI